MLSLAFAFMAATMEPGWPDARLGRCVLNICLTEWAMGFYYGLYNYFITIVFGCVAMVTYVFAVIAMNVRTEVLIVDK